jgi:hypothetical protein
MNLDTQTLAQMGKAGSRTRGLRSIRLDSGVQVYLPTAADFAALIEPNPQRELFRRPGGISSRERGSDVLGDGMAAVTVEELSEALVAMCAALPQRDDAGPAYISLRHLGVHEPDRLRRETVEAARAFRRSLPEEPKPHRERVEQPHTGKPAAQRMAEMRARVRRNEVESSAWYLEGFLEDAEPGERILGASLYEQASEAVEEMLDAGYDLIDEEDDDSAVYTVPGPRVFYGVADSMLGKRKRTAHGVTYTVPTREADTMSAPLFTRAELLAEMARQELATMREAAATAPTTTETEHLGNVVPFARRAV